MFGKFHLTKGLITILILFSTAYIFAQSQEIVAWGRDNHDQISGIPQGSDFIAIAAKGDHSIALRQNGSLEAWGLNTNGQCNVLTGNDFTAIAAGNFHSLALREDGTIGSWGRDNYNQVSATPTTADFAAVSGGYWHSLALRNNGTLTGWGGNSYGQCNVPAGNDFIAVEAGGFHSIALRENGTIVSWGRNWYNVLDVPPGNDFIAISAGYYQNIALRSNGTIVVWGGDQYNQVTNTPQTSDFVAVSTGLAHSMALREDGSVAAWGAGEEGQTGLFDYGQSIVPDGTDYVSIAAGRVHSVALIETEPPSDYTLTIGTEGSGTTVPAPGNHIYDVGEEVLITAVPDDDWLFEMWVINGTQVYDNPYTVTMNSNITAIAHFEPVPPVEYTLTIEIEGEGTTAPEPGEHLYEEGTEVELTAIPDQYWYFLRWMINGEEVVDNPHNLTVDSDLTVTAYFMLLPPPLNLTAEAGDGVVYLEWDFPDIPVNNQRQDLLGFIVYRDDEQLNTELLSETEYEDNEVINGETYYYYVTALYQEGESEPSNTVEATPQELLLPPPLNLEFEIIEDGVYLHWEPPQYDEDLMTLIGYNIYRDGVLLNTEPVEDPEYLDTEFRTGWRDIYTYYVTAVYLEGESDPSNSVEVEFSDAEDFSVSAVTGLKGNYPNPFNPQTTILYSVAGPGEVRIEIFNSLGQRIRCLMNSYHDPGDYRVVWNGKGDDGRLVGSGVYYYRLQKDTQTSVRRMVMIR